MRRIEATPTYRIVVVDKRRTWTASSVCSKPKHARSGAVSAPFYRQKTRCITLALAPILHVVIMRTLEDRVAAKKAEKPTQPTNIGGVAADGVDHKFFKDVAERLAKLTGQPPLLNIPIWGWSYTGKTCSILTAIHFCDALQHGLALSRIKDTSVLEPLQQRDEYRHLNLASIAEATVQTVDDYSEAFFENSTWPTGTDTPVQYLLEVRSRVAPVGYCLFPDIKGGSYERADDAAKNALVGAHALILTVEAERYVGKGSKAKEYKDDVHGMIQKCVASNTPVLIMMSKVDDPDHDKIKDEAHASLSVLLSSFGDVPAEIREVSVIGIPGNHKEKPPPVEQRDPSSLVRAWVWVLDKALERARQKDVVQAPRTNLGAAHREKPAGGERVRELRIIRNTAHTHGQVLCSLNGRSDVFLFLDTKNAKLHEVVVHADQDRDEVRSSVTIDQWQPPESIVAFATEGAVFVGPCAADRIWSGTKGQSLAPHSIPTALETWCVVSDRVIVGLAANGTLHAIKFTGGKWVASDYKANFIEPTAMSACGFVHDESFVLCHNGEVVQAIDVTANGKFDAKRTVANAVKYDGRPVDINRLGYVAARKSDGTFVFGREQGTVAPALLEGTRSFALAPDAPTVAWLNTERKLNAAVGVGGKWQLSAATEAAAVAEVPNGMTWGADGTLLIATFPNGQCVWAKRIGF